MSNPGTPLGGPASDQPPLPQQSPALPQMTAATLARVVALIQSDEALLGLARQVGEWLIGLSRPQNPERTATDGEPVAPPAPPRREVDLHLGGSPVRVSVRDAGPTTERPGAAFAPAQPRPVTLTPPATADRPDLALVVRRSLLKSESCEWAIERRRRLAAQADFNASIKPRDDDLLTRVRQTPACYAWPLDPYVSLPNDELLETAAACYRNLARAAELVLQRSAVEARDPALEEGFYLLAEAQSAVRQLMEELDLQPDADQLDAYFWLKHQTEERQIFISRHMRLADPASPKDWEQLGRRIEESRQAWDEAARRMRERSAEFNRARFHARKLAESTTLDPANDWNKLAHAVGRLLELGVPPSNVELREALLPIIDEMPEEYAALEPIVRVLTEIDRYLAQREADRAVVSVPAPTDPNVERVRARLRGRVVVMIGGERRPHSQQLIERAFELGRLEWISTRPHQSLSDFDAIVTRREVALVILAIRWSSHSYESIADLCASFNKPFVRLPGGYGVNQIAHHVLAQASDQLRDLPPL